jgi:hypothetical protein
MTAEQPDRLLVNITGGTAYIKGGRSGLLQGQHRVKHLARRPLTRM